MDQQRKEPLLFGLIPRNIQLKTMGKMKAKEFTRFIRINKTVYQLAKEGKNKLSIHLDPNCATKHHLLIDVVCPGLKEEFEFETNNIQVALICYFMGFEHTLSKVIPPVAIKDPNTAVQVRSKKYSTASFQAGIVEQYSFFRWPKIVILSQEDDYEQKTFFLLIEALGKAGITAEKVVLPICQWSGQAVLTLRANSWTIDGSWSDQGIQSVFVGQLIEKKVKICLERNSEKVDYLLNHGTDVYLKNFTRVPIERLVDVGRCLAEASRGRIPLQSAVIEYLTQNDLKPEAVFKFLRGIGGYRGFPSIQAVWYRGHRCEVKPTIFMVSTPDPQKKMVLLFYREAWFIKTVMKMVSSWAQLHSLLKTTFETDIVALETDEKLLEIRRQHFAEEI